MIVTDNDQLQQCLAAEHDALMSHCKPVVRETFHEPHRFGEDQRPCINFGQVLGVNPVGVAEVHIYNS